MEPELVQPRSTPEPDNAPGPFYVAKHHCIICALPNQTAPRNMAWSDLSHRRSDGCEIPSHCRVLKQPTTAEEDEEMIQALITSCVEAIRYRGKDPGILKRLRAEGKAHLADAIPEP